MGRNFPIIKNLSEVPDRLPQTLELIQRSFHYDEGQRFDVDFAPLVEVANHENCFLLLGEANEVLAHVGSMVRSIDVGGEMHLVCLLGGIAVAEHVRGQGYLQLLLTEVLAQRRDECALFMLWSNLDQLYEKFGFFQAGTQFEVSASTGPRNFKQTKLHCLTPQEKAQIQALYRDQFAKHYVTCVRSEADWISLEQVTSADLFLRRDGTEITAYFFMNKGQDLPGIIYEYAGLGEEAELLREVSAYGKIWMGRSVLDHEQVLFQFLLCPGNTKLLTALVLGLSDGRILIRDLNQIKREVFFEFDGDLLSLDLEEFFCGVFGPAYFEEVPGGFKPVFISGLDSI